MWKFIRHELKYWLKTPMIWIFMFINVVFTFSSTISDNLVIGSNAANVFKNAPYQIQLFYIIVPIFFLLMTTAFMNATANRDFQYGMYQFIFSSPISKRDYFFGKFIGALIVSIIPMLGLSIGALLAPVIAPILPFAAPAERFGEIYLSAHFQGLIAFGIPNVFISGVLLFSLAIIFRSTIVSFIGAMMILVMYGISDGLTKDIKNEWIANLLDPFGARPFEIMTKYFTPSEKNYSIVMLEGDLLINRLVWVGIGLLILVLVYFRFSFNAQKEKVKKIKENQKKILAPAITSFSFSSANAGKFSLFTLWRLVRFETKSIIKSPTYIIIMILGLILLIVNLATLTGSFGTSYYPVTYIVADTIAGSYLIFMYAFIIFYTGVLVWKERDAKINEIQDATPIQTGMLFTSKVIAIMLSIALVLAFSILLGVIAQTLYGYTRYEIGVYVKSLLLIRLSGYFFMIVLSLLFHYLINNRYIAWFAFAAFIIINSFIWGALEINTNMVSFPSRPNVTFSDMNGFGPFIPGMSWFTLYWTLFCLVLCFVITKFYIRGKEEQFSSRWTAAKARLKHRKLPLLLSIILFALCAGFIYYNTQVLNTYDSPKDGENMQVDYEKNFKKYENIVQPRYYKFNYDIAIFPEDRSVTANIEAWAKNISNQPISELHFTMPGLTDSIKLNIPDSKLKMKDKRLYYRIYTLDKPLAPQDSIKIDIKLWKITEGFENEVSFKQLTHNGTFFNNADLLPTFGYNKDYEISDKNLRIKRKLPKRERMPKLDDNNMAARANTYISNDSDWVDVNTVISTSDDQIAIAPGSLIKQWKADGRNYFNYKLDQKALNFYSFISAKYEVAKRKWNGIGFVSLHKSQ